VRTIGTLLVFVVVALLLRSTAMTALSARGIVIDVLAFATVVWALRFGPTWGTSFGFALGLAADLDSVHRMGRHALILCLVGYGVGRIHATVVRDSARTQAVLVFLGTLVHQVWVMAFEVGGPAGWPYLLRHVVLAVLVTTPVGTLLLALVRRVSGPTLFGHASLQPGPTP
jgi:rod shape-determining protein MreD